MARKLATIQRISKLESIPNADKIEVAHVLGWKAVVEKGKHKEGELVIYFEVDSFLPIREGFEFLRKACYKKLADGTEGFRLRTIRLRGQISQGLVMPISILPPGTVNPEEGLDITNLIGITLYQPPIPACLAGEVKGKFPSWIPKTDETRVQVLQPILTKYKGTKCYITEKIDGSSVTFYLKDGEFGVCSRNLDLKETPGNAYWQAARDLKVEEKLRALGKNIAIQGELFGHGIQDNPLKIEGRTVKFFSVFDIDKYQYLDYEDFYRLILGVLDLDIVPILDNEFILTDNIDELIKIATGISVLAPVPREGIVIRPLKEIIDLQMSELTMSNARVTFKAVNPEYLLAEL